MSDIHTWLDGLGLGQYAENFRQNDIDRDLLPDLTDDDLRNIGVTTAGHRVRLRKAIAALDAAAAPAGDTGSAPTRAGEAERRQITVMFCDLVGSTALSEQLDPEDLRDVIAAYRHIVAAAVKRYDGYIAQYLGDGVMAYFGWPLAHEDDAERSIRSALDCVDAVKSVTAPRPLQVRIGIATGPVVVGHDAADPAQTDRLAVGETPNLAARLQGLAGADEIVIGHGTHRLVPGAFVCHDLGARDLKGIVEPVRAWRVTGVSDARGRFAARAVGGLTRFVGRDEEIDLILRRWQQAQTGEGQVVLLSGEPGIGKSRIAQVLVERIAHQPHGQVQYQCSPYHANSAFYPFIQEIERSAGFERGDDVGTKRDKLRRWIADGIDDPEDVEPLFAAMLTLPMDPYPPSTLSPQSQKDRTIAAVIDRIAGLAADAPLFILFEDVHWCDPTGLDALTAMIDRLKDWRALLVVTSRPEFAPPWSGRGHVTMHSLNRLGRDQGRDIVTAITGGRSLPGELHDQIIAKTDGVPLFVEELTKAVIEGGLVVERDDGYALAGPAAHIAIPSTLQDSLMARLDRFPTAREVAQIGSCLGREFSYDVLAAVAPLAQAEVQTAIDQLVASQLIYRTGGAVETILTFKHALVQDAAYQSLLKARRREIHLSIARILAARFPHSAAQAPEDLARHYSIAEDLAHALPLWLEAGELALGRFANIEAVHALQAGLDLIAAAPDPSQFVDVHIALHLRVAAALRILDRYDEAFDHLQPAEVLCVAGVHDRALSEIHHLRGNLHFPRGQFEQCRFSHEQALEHARRARSIVDEANALGGLGDAAYAEGRIRTAHDHFAAYIALCERHDLATTVLANQAMLSITKHYLGDLGALHGLATRAAAAARQSGDMRAEMIAHHSLFFYHYERAEDDAAKTAVAAALDLSRAIGSPRFEAESLTFEALVQADQAVDLLTTSLEICRKDSMVYMGPIVLVSLAEVDPERSRRAALLAEAEDLLAAPSLSHNHFWFRRSAIFMALSAGDGETATRHADRLAEYTEAEPLPWPAFQIDLARTLAPLIAGDRSPDRMSAVARLRGTAQAAGYIRADRFIEQLSSRV